MKDRQEQLIAHYQKALLIKHNNANIYHQLGKTYLYGGEFERAFYSYIKAIHYNYSSHLYYPYLRFCLLATNYLNKVIDPSDLELGITVVNKLIQSQPSFLFAQLLLGDLLSLQGKIKEAIACYQNISYQQTLTSHPELTKQHWNHQQLRQPDFIICGLCKCGTTSLYNYLAVHPQVLAAVEKEIYFFSHYLERGADWYFAHFPAIQGNTYYLTGEATPLYLVSANPQKIFQLLPKIKLIVLLRNPIDRLLSSFHQFNRLGVKQHCLDQTINITLKRIRKISIPDFISSKEEIKYSLDELPLTHLLPSLYIYYIQKWMNVFPREQFLILKSEDLSVNPSAIVKQVYNFLNLPDYQLTEYRNHNIGSYPAISNDLRRQLVDFFHPYNQQLEEYLGMKFNWE